MKVIKECRQPAFWHGCHFIGDLFLVPAEFLEQKVGIQLNCLIAAGQLYCTVSTYMTVSLFLWYAPLLLGLRTLSVLVHGQTSLCTFICTEHQVIDTLPCEP